MSRPPQAASMTTPLKLRVIASKNRINGALVKTYKDAEEPVFMANFKTYGGTERAVNGVYLIEDTASVVTWFRPDIKSDCRIVRLSDGATFEVLNEPEDVEQRHQFLSFKVRRLKGGA